MNIIFLIRIQNARLINVYFFVQKSLISPSLPNVLHQNSRNIYSWQIRYAMILNDLKVFVHGCSKNREAVLSLYKLGRNSQVSAVKY